LLLVLAGALAYSDSFRGVFLPDDRAAILEPGAQGWFGSGRFLVETRQLLTELTFAANYQTSERDPGSYHLFNLVLHLANALLLYGVVRRTLTRRRDDLPTALRAPLAMAALACGVALLWALHPLTTQSVTYIAQRGQLLLGFFVLLTLYCILRLDESVWGWSIAAVAACALGVASNAAALVTPLIAVVFAATFLAPSWRAALGRRWWPLYVALAGVCVLLGILLGLGQVSTILYGGRGLEVQPVSRAQYLLAQPGALVHYLRLAFWPKPLCLDYAWAPATGFAQVIAPASAVLALLAATAWGVWRRAWWGAPAAVFFLILAPTSSFIPHADLLAEQRMYLPLAMLGVLVVIGAALGIERLGRGVVVQGSSPPALSKSSGMAAPQGSPPPSIGTEPVWRLGVMAVLALSAVLGLNTYTRNLCYRDVAELWQTVLDVQPDNPRAHYEVALACAEAGAMEKAVGHWTRALQQDPQSVELRLRLAAAYLGFDPPRAQAALAVLEKAPLLAPQSAPVQAWLGRALLATGQAQRLSAAEAHLQMALDILPHYADAVAALGEVMCARGHCEEGRAYLETERLRQPGADVIRFSLAKVLLRTAQDRYARGDVAGSGENLTGAVQNLLDLVRFDEGEAAAGAGRMKMAVATLLLRPDLARVRSELAKATYAQGIIALNDMGNAVAAARALVIAVSLEPQNRTYREAFQASLARSLHAAMAQALAGHLLEGLTLGHYAIVLNDLSRRSVPPEVLPALIFGLLNQAASFNVPAGTLSGR
jgi:tetratricopeptide (TPR) repeat protein